MPRWKQTTNMKLHFFLNSIKYLTLRDWNGEEMPRASTHCSTKKWILYQTATDLSVNKQYITSDKTCIMIREAKNHVISKGVIYRFYWLCSLIPAGCRGTLLHMHARGKSHLLDDLIRCCWSYSCKNRRASRCRRTCLACGQTSRRCCPPGGVACAGDERP